MCQHPVAIWRDHAKHSGLNSINLVDNQKCQAESDRYATKYYFHRDWSMFYICGVINTCGMGLHPITSKQRIWISKST